MKRSTYVIRQYREGRRDFRGLDLKREDLKETDLSEADFSGSDIRGVSFKNTNLANTHFEQIKAGQPLSNLSFVLIGSIGFIILSMVLLVKIIYFTCMFITSDSFLVQFFGYTLIFILITLFSITYYNNLSGLLCFTGGSLGWFLLLSMSSALSLSFFALILVLLIIFSFLYCFIRSIYALSTGNNKHFNISYSYLISSCFSVAFFSFIYGFNSTLSSWIYISFIFFPFISLFFTIIFYILKCFNLVKKKTWLQKFAHNFSSFGSTSFVSANLTNARFTDTNLKTTRFYRADISQACFDNVKINIEQIQQAKN